MLQSSTDSFTMNTARFHLVKNYMSRGFSPEEVSEATDLPIDIVKYEINKLIKESKRITRDRRKSIEGVNISGGFGYHAVFH
jgi:hypothetical protein